LVDPNLTVREDQAISCLVKGESADATHLFEALLMEGFLLSARFLGNLAIGYHRLGCWRASELILEKAVQIFPHTPELYYLHGLASRQNDNPSKAEELYRHALLLNPGYSAAWIGLGELFHQVDPKSEQALLCYRKALEIDDSLLTPLVNSGNIYWYRGDFGAAAFCFKAALAIDSSSAYANYNMGRLKQQIGAIDQAVSYYRLALDSNPGLSQARWNLSICLLLAGDYREGLRGYDARLGLSSISKLHVEPRLSLWQGEDIGDAPLLLVTEQGLGDTIQFMRYVPVLKQNGVCVRFCAPSQLHSLIIASDVHGNPASIKQSSRYADGYWLPLLSLPRILAIEPRYSADSEPYIKPLRTHVEKWQKIFRSSAPGRPVVGIHWQGNPVVESENPDFYGRSFSLESFSELLDGNDLFFASLQKGAGCEQLENCSFRHAFVPFQSEIDKTWDFLETAAIIVNCDLVITSDSAVAHLAGGLGMPTWLLLKKVPEWRWGLESERTFWYPSIRIFRQQEDGDWASVFKCISTELSVALAEGHFDQDQRLADVRYGNDRRIQLAALKSRLLGWSDVFWDWISAEGDHRGNHDLHHLDSSLGQPDFFASDEAHVERFSRSVEVAHQYVDQGDWDRAELILRAAIGFGWQSARHYALLGYINLKNGQLDMASSNLGLALELDCSVALTCFHLAVCFHQQGLLSEAKNMYDRALENDAANPDIVSAYGCLLHEMSLISSANEWQRRAIELDPSHASAHHSLAAGLLTLHRYEEGWAEFDWRLKRRDAASLYVSPDTSLWDGVQSLAGQKLLVIGEQGFGDCIQFLRYVSPLKAMGAHCVLCIPAPLHQLVSRSGIGVDLCVPDQVAPCADDRWIPLLSLPRLLGVRPERPVVSAPYLAFGQSFPCEWRNRLHDDPRFKVAICWQGSPEAEKFVLRGRSLPLSAFDAVFRDVQVGLVSLQKGYGLEQLEHSPLRESLVACQSEIDAAMDFLDVAAVISNCELVITSDTAVAHLAGAMGHPTWLLLHHVPDWRWGLEGETTFWYPSMRLFRQREAGNWDEVMERVATALQEFLASRSV
jgi:tetratricopeptide (TPR) repeat protein